MIYLYVLAVLMVSNLIVSSVRPISIKIFSKLITTEQILYWILIIWLAWIIGTRGLTGTDTFTYEGAFHNPSAYQYFEPGYQWVSKNIADFGFDFSVLQWVMSIGTMFIFGFAYALATPKIMLSLIYFVGTGIFYTLFNTMRQGMAEALFLLSVILFFKLNGKKKYIITFLLMYCSYLFHASVLIVILFSLLGIVICKFLGEWFYFVAIIISIIGLVGIRMPIDQFSSLFSKVGLTYIDAYGDNLGSVNYGIEGYIIILLFLIIVMIIHGSRKLAMNNIFKMACILFSLYLIIASSFGYDGLMNRFLNYFVPFFPIVFVYLPEATESNRKKSIVELLIYVYILEFTIYTFLSNYQSILPYRP
ncbi:EpsG family protein [Leuconostoc gasicomitatum]|uniref:Capsular polysaccharide biosynthesis protein n=1 Tax=Leuconostoc gasicomitatum TaxID=115778 RepID=A0ABP2B2S9_9LACO|nr:EpsG family protein [Leuconostoc gasicomitatum]MBR2276379.1 EpsG family protein [Leuconostoc sp.]MBZ5954375.1 EpsG family protein [Leuconostoc gasicomitatum]MBZ5970016.1 EpsG family protein [Leuconostoc gasicomitatum]MBZ5973534.1 EpsG family protein [Leuconostoc gasicomitatum]MBZ5997631.1 EpsG family protein [Leuconostoc gasicomitatum]